jgi:hypothetical protein
VVIINSDSVPRKNFKEDAREIARNGKKGRKKWRKKRGGGM